MSENLYINLTASSHETNIISNSQVVKEKLNLENLTDLTFLPHAISNNDRLNYLDKEHLKNLIKISPKIQKSTFAVSSVVGDHLSQDFKFCKPNCRLFLTVFT